MNGISKAVPWKLLPQRWSGGTTSPVGPHATLCPHESHRQKGHAAQGMVEFALVMPVFLMLMVGVVDGSRLVAAYAGVSSSAAEGARVAVVASASDDAIRKASQDAAALMGSAASVSITPTLRKSGDLVIVTVSYSFLPNPLLATFMGGSISLTGSASMRVE